MRYVLFILTITCILMSQSILSQRVKISCGDELLKNQTEKIIPGYKESVAKAFQHAKVGNMARTNLPLRIPVVFHVIWLNSVPAQNIPDSCIFRQIEILNEAYSAKNSDRTQLRSVFNLAPHDAEIEFYLASTDPDGKATNGIVRKSTTKKFAINIISGIINVDMKDSNKGGSSPWDVNKYMNVWVVNMPIEFLGQEQVGILGFATPPNDLPNWPEGATEGTGPDGIVIQYQFIGDNNPAFQKLGSEFSIADKGKTLIHESGHYLGLRHIWADKGDPLFGTPSCLNANNEIEDDGMGDTPYCGSNSQITGCNDAKNTCTEGSNDKPDMWENYMDYSEEKCQINFTPEQIAFMRNVIVIYRKSLVRENTSAQDKETIDKNWWISPNPISNSTQMTLYTSNYNEIVSRIECFSSYGQKIQLDWLYSNWHNSTSTSIDINIQKLPTGYYMLTLYAKDGTTSSKKFLVI